MALKNGRNPHDINIAKRCIVLRRNLAEPGFIEMTTTKHTFFDMDTAPSGQQIEFLVRDFVCEFCGRQTPEAVLQVIPTDNTVEMFGRLLRFGVVAGGLSCGCQVLAEFELRARVPQFPCTNVDDRLVEPTLLPASRLAEMQPGIYDFRHDYFCPVCRRWHEDFTYQAFLTEHIGLPGKPLSRLAYFISKPPCPCTCSLAISPTHSKAL
jgi:hypothetical protein